MPWLRSEEMMYVEVVTAATEAHDVLHFLGSFADGVIQFSDLNKRLAAYSRPQTSEIKRWEAMERQLRYFRASLEAHGIPIAREKRVESFFRSAGNDGDEDGVGSDDGATAGSTLDDAAVAEQQAQAGPFHPEARRRLAEELREREESLKISLRMESDLSRSHNRILAQRSVVQTAQSYFNGGSRRSGGGSRRRKARDAAAARSSRDTAFPDDDDDDAGSSDFRFEHVMGVLHAGKQPAFERLLHRVLRSLNFKLHFAKCLEPGTEDEVVAFVDPETGAIGVEKVVFIISLRGENMRKKIVRICQAFEAEAVEVSDLDRHALEDQLQAVDEDIGRTLQLVDSNRDVTREAMTSIASQIVEWGWIVAREKEIFVEMSKFASSGGHHMRGVGWVVKRFFGEILSELGADSQRFPNTHCTPVSTARGPWPKAPTHFFTNKFTAVFQGLVDTYGVPRYREINPALFTAITFPFIFGVMYGDIGHGFILTLAGAFLLLKEQEWSARKLGEMEAMAFGGRYLLFMMGIFAMYCGFIYNDMFALGLNIFTVGWKEPVAGTKEFRRGGYLTSETYEPYIFGLDPTWKRAENDLNFQNSFKMKLSVIFGITQMTAGLVLRLLNSIYSVARPSDRVGEGLVDVLFEVLPQLVFMISIFGYLVVLIFIKWCTDWDVAQQCGQGAPFTEAFFKAPGTAWTKMDTDRCALEQTATNACFFPAMSRYPTEQGELVLAEMYGCNQVPAGIINMLISMVLKPFTVDNPLFANQLHVQWVLLTLAGIAIPLMLVPRPFILAQRESARHAALHDAPRANGGGGGGADEEDPFGFDDSDDEERLGASDEESQSFISPRSKSSDSDRQTHAMLELPDDDNDEHGEHSLADLFIHQGIETIEFVLGCVSNTASYLRLWALSLAHAQLAATFWNLIMVNTISMNAWYAPILVFAAYYVFAGVTIGVMLMMDVLECFLHALRLHWVEFQNKFYHADGYAYVPFSFVRVVKEMQGF